MHGSKAADPQIGAREDLVYVQIRQHRGEALNGGVLGTRGRNGGELSYEVKRGPDGSLEIPLACSSATLGTRMPRNVLMRSSFLAQCLVAPEGVPITRRFTLGDEANDHGDDLADDPKEEGMFALTCTRVEEAALEINLPSQSVGDAVFTPGNLAECLELSAPGTPLEPGFESATSLVVLFVWAIVLQLNEVVAACRKAIVATISVAAAAQPPIHLALALAIGHATGDEDVLQRCYWCLRELICSASGPPPEWLRGSGNTRLINDALCHQGVCRTPLQSLAGALAASLSSKRARWATPVNCYTLCQVHRRRGERGAYPHIYEMRLDHTDEILLTALREDETSTCRIFAGSPLAIEEASEHCEEYLGGVVPNFWGTLFSLYDSGVDVKALRQRLPPAARALPLREQSLLCRIGYETNILGSSPRKITVDFERDRDQYHMENLQPRWDKKLNSYALPFFGRVKKASAKNFQLVLNSDMDTIYLMFGKISKDVFCLDYRGPIAALDAMAIACAALAKKRAVS